MTENKTARTEGVLKALRTYRAEQGLSALPERWIVAQRGMVKEATPSLTPFFFAWASVTGIVAADEAVPKAVK